MKMYIASELLKEKREKHIYLGAISILMCLILTLSNFYKLTQRASVLDLYCDNMEFIFFITLLFTILYTIVIFADEHRYGTIYQLEIIPVSSRKFVLAKLVVIAFLSTITMVFPSLVYAIIIGIRGYDFSFYTIAVLLLINIIDALLLTAVMLPIVFIVTLCKGNYIPSLLLSFAYMILCFFIPSFPISQSLAQKLLAYAHPLGGYALIHNWLIYKLVPYETSMILEPKENGILALGGMILWGMLCLSFSIIIMKRKGK